MYVITDHYLTATEERAQFPRKIVLEIVLIQSSYINTLQRK